MTLEFARSHPVEPGSNQRGEQADTTWLFLVPTLELSDVVIVGSAPFGTLRGLDALARRVSVIRPTWTMRRRLRHLTARRGERMPIDVLTHGFPLRPADLVYVAPWRSSSLVGDERAMRWLGKVLEAGGSVYVGGRARREQSMVLARRLGIRTCVTVGPADGRLDVEAQGGASALLIPATAAPAPHWVRRAINAVRVARRVTQRLSRSSTGASARISEPEGSLGVSGVGPLPAQSGSGTGVLLRGANQRSSTSIPEYLARAAEAAGIPLRPSGWRLAPPRGYRSQKVIFFANLEDGTRVVVKLTQESRFNGLLENEALALARLGDADLGNELTAPRLRFQSRHAGLTIVVQDALAGHAFVNVAQPGPGSEQAAAVGRALVLLAQKTKQPSQDVAEALLEITGHYHSLYDVTARQSHRLNEQTRILGALGSDLPTVFMHGDATVYNVLVDEGSRVGLVDWENAEDTGMPLWDLFHFRQAHAGWTAEQAGVRYTPRLFASQFLGDTVAENAVTPAIETACRELELPDQAVEPLLHTWLAWHAVREARQLAPVRLRKGFYHRVLAGALDH